MTAAHAPGTVRTRAHVSGLVQGVGFRPFVWREATSRGLSGWVSNDPAGVALSQTTAREHSDALRAPWGIENRLHWVRDVAFAEGLSQIQTGHGPAVMAKLRNLAINLHRKAGAHNIAAACRTVSRHPGRAPSMST